jgi:aspartyl-tRNA(Asn)/glutamyl-tRNA(Gln) amidotransferase subunit A
VPDLSPGQVADLARALGLPVGEDDLDEVTHRLNGFLDVLGGLEALPLDTVALDPPAPPAAGPEPAAAAKEPAPPRDEGEPVLGSAARQVELLRRGELSPLELVRAHLERIERLDGALRAYITVCAEAALAEARAAETARARGRSQGPLHGLPFAVKDQFDTAGVRTTVGSRLFADRVPAGDATLVARLRAAGGILLGKLNCSELALGDTVDFPYGQPRNPWQPAHHPGGSSGGSGVAVAAALCAVSLGEDTGGSVRGPAAYCGVVGLRPTWGRLSRAGCFPLAWSLDAPGPLGRTVEDCALVLELLAGPDPADPTALAAPPPACRPGLDGGVRGLRVGLVGELVDGPDTDPEMRAAARAAAGILAGLGAQVEETSLALAPVAGAVSMALTDTEGAGRHLRALRERPADLDRNTRRRLLAASLLPAGLVQRAQRARALVRAELLERLRRFDLLLAPASPGPAPRIADGRAPITSAAAAAGCFFTRRSYATPASLAGVPALSVPCGFSAAGLPLGLQLIGRPLDEPRLLRCAHAYERAAGWWRRRPALDRPAGIMAG